MASSTKYETYRILQPIIREKHPSLFDTAAPLTPEERRVASIRAAIERGVASEGSWVAGAVASVDGGIKFKIGLTERQILYKHEGSAFVRFEDRFTRLTDVIIDFETGLMLIRRDKTTPSAYLASRAFARWLEETNQVLETGFDTVVQPVPVLEDFLKELREANNISVVTFVVRAPNPADEEDIVRQIALFTQKHEIVSTTVSLNAPNIDVETATDVAKNAGKMGNRVSATITDKKGRKRTIRTRKKARTIEGERDPDPEQARGLIATIRRILDAVGVGTGDGRDERTR